MAKEKEMDMAVEMEEFDPEQVDTVTVSLDDGRELAQMLAERTRSQVVQVIGRKIVLYRPAKEEKKRKIILPEK